MASSRCWILRPEGPGAESRGKLFKTLARSSSEMSAAIGREFSSGQMGLEAGGCKSRRLSAVASSSGRTALLRRAAQAFRSKPSRQRASALLRRLEASSDPAGGLLRSWATSSQRVARSPASQQDRRSRVKAAAVFLCFLPPRGGARRTLLGNIRNCFQESVELVSLIKAKARVMAWAHISRAAFGMCFKVLGRAFKMSENEGKFWPMSSSSSRASVWGVVAASLVLRFSSAAQVG